MSEKPPANCGEPEPGEAEPGEAAPGVDVDVDADSGPEEPPPPSRPGLTTFTIEGRAAPGLFVVGWLASISGLALVLIGAVSPSALFLYFLGPVVLTIGLVAGAGSQAIERRARGSAYAGPSPYLVFATIVAAVFAVGAVVGLGLRLVLGSTEVPGYLVNLVGVAIQATVFLGIIRLTVVGTEALTWTDMGWRRLDTNAIRNLLFGAALAIPVIGLTAVVADALVAIFNQVPPSPLPATGLATGLVVQLIAGAVIAPIAEETVFRGFAISAWQRTVGERGALVRASVVFALAHVITVSGDSLAQVGGLIAVGFATRIPVAFALGWLYLRTRSIWAPLGLHMAFNGILLILAEYVRMNGAA
ncbi:MAG TPA: type II CAAX endopeptidase family protein [Candidatus Limnocylindrales bacterium]|nr:type II CAAX endopeptidase family protein [Candidatus Limnocylindrales bacterium]